MKKLLFLFLRLVKTARKLSLAVQGKTVKEVQDKRVVTGKTWEDFCDNLKAAGASRMFPGTPRDPFQQAEGIRYLSRLVRGGLEAFLEYSDPAFPVFRQTAHETIKLGADNPDNVYLNAQVSGGYEYVIRGKRNTINYIGFFTQNGSYGTTGGLSPCGYLDSRDLVTAADGSFEIMVTREKTGTNWLKIEKETTMVMVRQTFFDRSAETAAEVIISNLNGQTAPAPLSAAKVDDALANAALFVGGASMLFARWAKDFQKHTNQLPMFDPAKSNAAGGDAGIIYYHSHWKLDPGEALVIEVVPPECESWNFQLNNYWMESLDYRYHRICINKATAKTKEDGKVKVIVSATDPGLPNWIETAGHTEGTMLWRWYRLKTGSSPVQPSCRVVQVSKLNSES